MIHFGDCDAGSIGLAASLNLPEDERVKYNWLLEYTGQLGGSSLGRTPVTLQQLLIHPMRIKHETVCTHM